MTANQMTNQTRSLAASPVSAWTIQIAIFKMIAMLQFLILVVKVCHYYMKTCWWGCSDLNEILIENLSELIFALYNTVLWFPLLYVNVTIPIKSTPLCKYFDFRNEILCLFNYVVCVKDWSANFVLLVQNVPHLQPELDTYTLFTLFHPTGAPTDHKRKFDLSFRIHNLSCISFSTGLYE